MTNPAPAPQTAPVPGKPIRDERARRKRFLAEAATTALIFHVAAGLVAGMITIVVIATRSPVTFEAKRPPSVPARRLEHSIRVKQMKEQMRKPQILQRLVAQSPTAVALPELPQMEMPDQKTLRDMPTMRRAGGALGALGGRGGGAGRGLAGGMGYSDTKFFGQNVRTRAIVLLLDASQTLINKGVLDDVMQETATMLDGLAPVTKFNVIGFIDGAAAMFPQMVFATQTNRAVALSRMKRRPPGRGGDPNAWTADGFLPNRVGNLPGYSGSTPWKAIEMAVEMGADTIFIVMDDEPPYVIRGRVGDPPIETHKDDILDYVEAIPTKTGNAVKINVVMYEPRDNKRGRDAVDFYRRLCRETGGRLTFFGERQDKK